MSLKIEDVLQANVVLVGVRLLNTQSDRASFSRIVGTEVTESPGVGELTLNAPTGVPIDLAPRTLVLNRDRISLTLLPNRTTISRDYPSESDLERLGDVAKHAIERSNLEGQQLQSFGFNMEVVYEVTTGETAVQFIGSRILASNPFEDAGFSFLGGQCRFSLSKSGQLWNIAIEPRLGDPGTNKIFLSLNLHKEERKIPSRYVIRNSLNELWSQAHSIMDSVRRDQ